MTTPILPPVNPTTGTTDAPPSTTTTGSTIDTSIPAINSFAVELDSTPVSPIQRKPDPSLLSETKSISPEEDEEAYEEFTGEKGEGELVREVSLYNTHSL